MNDLRQQITGLSRDDLQGFLQEIGQPAFRSTQILDWVWKKRVSSFSQMLNLPEGLRASLRQQFQLRSLIHARTQESQDTTRKFLFKLPDSRFIESVLIPASPGLYGEASERRTLCVSSQVGCAYGCRFCASGLEGLTRNLTPAEITEQILLAEEISRNPVNNIVFMGMGEPLANLPNLLRAIEIITSPWGLNIGARRLTISTSGLAPQIKKLADHPQQIRLAISLHGPTDEVRNRIMPVNEKWNLESLFEALRYWKERKKQRLTLEYILISGVNDDIALTAPLARWAKSINAKVNLIPYNLIEGFAWKRPSDEHCLAFRDRLISRGILTTLRLEKGNDIVAACGQLRLREERTGKFQN